VKIYFETYGCTLNKADTALMKSILVRAGHEIVDDVSKADVIVINTCTVRKDTEDRILRRIKELYNLTIKNGKKLVIAGCMVSAQPYTLRRIAPNASLVSPQNIVKIKEVVEASNNLYLILGERDTNYLETYIEGVTAAIPIAEGCLGDCSFCIVKIARRRLRSYKPELILKVVREAVSKGVVEVDLTAQDTASYGIDLGGPRLHELINMIVESIPEKFYIRIGMANPDTLIDILDGVIEVLKHPKVYKYMHIPLQSGDDKVLKLMNRRYTYDEYKSIIKELRRKIPEITIATDIIVGHPGEDEEAFQNSIKAVKELMFDKVHLAQYTLRPRTEAAAMPQIPDPIKKERSKILTKVIEEVGFRINKDYIGSHALTVVTQRSFRGGITGRTINYKPVVIYGNGFRGVHLGSEIYVRIVQATFYDLRGHPLEWL